MLGGGSRWLNVEESERSGMAVLDVTIPTGYIIQQQKLDQYILQRNVRNLLRARFDGHKVLFYFHYVSINLFFIASDLHKTAFFLVISSRDCSTSFCIVLIQNLDRAEFCILDRIGQ